MSLADELSRQMGGAPGVQADATRAPSGMTRKLQGDVDRKMHVLANEQGGNLAPIPFLQNRVNGALATANWGRTFNPTDQTRQRDDNVKDVGKSLDATKTRLAGALKADRDRRNP